MKTTAEHFANYNKKQIKKLIPIGDEEIIGTFTNGLDEVFNLPSDEKK